jgi:hypothetical protein
VAVVERRQRRQEEGTRDDIDIYFNESRMHRVHVRLEENPSSELRDFAIMQQTLRDGTWVDVVRYDCCHGSFHVHRFTWRGSESREQLGDRSNLDKKFRRATVDILKDWEQNWRRYLDD